MLYNLNHIILFLALVLTMICVLSYFNYQKFKDLEKLKLKEVHLVLKNENDLSKKLIVVAAKNPNPEFLLNQKLLKIRVSVLNIGFTLNELFYLE